MKTFYIENTEKVEDEILDAFSKHENNIIYLNGEEMIFPVVVNLTGQRMDGLKQLLGNASYKELFELLNVTDARLAAAKIKADRIAIYCDDGGLDVLVVGDSESNSESFDLFKQIFYDAIEKNKKRKELLEKANLEIIKISGESSVRSTASFVTKKLADTKKVELHAVGASAVNQAFKISVQTRSELARRGEDLFIIPGMKNKRNPSGKEISVSIFRFILE